MAKNPLNQLLLTYPDKAMRLLLRTYGFQSQYIETRIASHHLYSISHHGSLPPLVFLHGGGDSAASFTPVMLALRHRVQSITALEIAGHGLSSEPKQPYGFKEHYASMNEALDAVIKPQQPAVIIGNSLGGLTAFKYAEYNPARVRGLFLISPVGSPLTTQQLAELRQVFMLRTPAAAREFVEFTNPHLSSAKKALASRVALVWLNRAVISGLVQQTTIKDKLDPAVLQSLSMPIQIISGQHDGIMTPEALEYFRTHLPPSATIVEPPDMGHTPHHDHPNIIASMILKFLNQLERH